MSPEGPVPIQSKLDADTLEQAMDAFPQAMQQALVDVIEKLKQLQQQQMQQKNDSRIIMPGQ
jgi:transposase